MNTQNTTAVKTYLQQLQTNLVASLLDLDPKATHQVDQWQHQQGGGCSQVIADGTIFEKGGVNFSQVIGSALPTAATAARPELAGASFTAMGVSVVLHTVNPYVPATHCNVRYFIAEKPGMEPVWWFGGGFDLTPYYGFVEDCQHWHQTAKAACEPFGAEIYPEFKKWCDEYFYLKHRQECRGIGGLFFDDLNRWDFATSFKFMQSVGDNFIPAYRPIVEQRARTAYGEREKLFQQFRRARYVEFNLVFDRGTLFGLQTGGRTESILISMPPQANWGYQWTPEAGTAEAKLAEDFLKPRDWV